LHRRTACGRSSIIALESTLMPALAPEPAVHGSRSHRGADLDALLLDFYRVPRAGVVGLSDGGGPFGFDITVAIQVDYAIRAFDCDGIVETGCFLGDTTEFLARRYNMLPVVTCDIVDQYSQFTRQRLAAFPQVTVLTGDSTQLLPQMLAGLARPLVFLDAHWYDCWPLRAEFSAVQHVGYGVVCVDDFFIGHPRFGYDTYAGQRCDADLVAQALPKMDVLYVGNPHASYPAPCLQVGRRSGTAFIAIGLNSAPLAGSDFFSPVRLRPDILMPDWPRTRGWITRPARRGSA
jgi:hypothetical protein